LVTLAWSWLSIGQHAEIAVGLRRGEALLLEKDSLKQDIDPHSGEVLYWLDVTACFDADPRATAPSMKTPQSHRQIPVSDSFAELYLQYVGEIRQSDGLHPYLLTARGGARLSAESLTMMFERLFRALLESAQAAFYERCGKDQLSPHDLRHTCATARYSVFLEKDRDRELALQRMRAFFGWSIKSHMPEHYARPAIQNDLMRSWNDLFEQRINVLRSIPR